MKVLIVSSGNSGRLAPFVAEQADWLVKQGVEVIYFSIIGKGILGYLSNLKNLKKKVRIADPDIIHAHYGLSGFLALLIKGDYPLVTTFHGNDINPSSTSNTRKLTFNRVLSKLTHWGSNYSIFVNPDFAVKIKAIVGKYECIPCHVDLECFYPIDKKSAREKMGLADGKRYILFSSAFNFVVKNYPLAREAMQNLQDVEIIELKNYTRTQVNLLLNACDIALMTSLTEGSPQFIKEAMACNCPIVSTDVGDVLHIVKDTVGCYVTTFEVDDIRAKIERAISFSQVTGKTDGRKRIIDLGLDPYTISNKIIEVYSKVK